MKLGALQSINADLAPPFYRVGSGAARTLSVASAATSLPIEPGLITLSHSVSGDLGAGAAVRRSGAQRDGESAPSARNLA